MNTSKQNYYRILSLDGGGSWALIQAKALFNIYKKQYGDGVTGHQVLSNFDYAGANSGGAIVLAALIQNWPLQQLIDFFNTQSKREE
ncbi:MAG TPA: patatin-like phospholipase family protein, partial [Bacteroidia bacterium]|nr:patatin-like phospholipase family protein [Bacteroidia bacterium]